MTDDADRRTADGGDTDSDRQALTIDKRKTVIAIVLAVVLAGGAFTALGQVTQFSKLHTALTHADKPWLPAALLGQVLAYLGYMLAYHAVARASGGPRFSYRATAQIVIFGTGASILGASVGGLAVDYWALRRTGTKPRVATRRVLAVGTLEWTVLSLYALTAAALALATGSSAPTGMALAWLLTVPACAASASWFTSPRRAERYIDPEPCRPHSRVPAARALAWVRTKLSAAIADAIAGVILVRHLLSHPLRYRGAAVGYPIYWAGDMLTLYCGLRAFGVSPDPIVLILAYCTSFVISSLPLPAGGAGGVEAAMALALHSVGIAFAPALLGVFTYRIITFWLPVVPTLLLIPTLRRLHRSLPGVSHTQPDSDEGLSFRPQPGTR